MKNLKPQSTAGLTALFLLATGGLTGALLSSGAQHPVPAAKLEIDPAIPALVIVGKRLAPQATVTAPGTPGQSTTPVQHAAVPLDGTARLAAVSGL